MVGDAAAGEARFVARNALIVIDNFSFFWVACGFLGAAFSVAKDIGVVARETVVVRGSITGLAGCVAGDASVVDKAMTVVDITLDTLVVDKNPSVGGVAWLGVGGNTISFGEDKRIVTRGTLVGASAGTGQA